MPQPFNVHLTFLNFSQLYLVRNHQSMGVRLPFGFSAEVLFLACVKSSWGFLYSSLGKYVFTECNWSWQYETLNCSTVLIALPPWALSHFSSCLKPLCIYPPFCKLSTVSLCAVLLLQYAARAYHPWDCIVMILAFGWCWVFFPCLHVKTLCESMQCLQFVF